jgi:nucleoside-diphosphate-sugar epimerase
VKHCGFLVGVRQTRVPSLRRVPPHDACPTLRNQINPDLDVFDDARESDAEHTPADVSKTNDLPEYEPAVDIREGVRQFIVWYRDNEN